MLHFFWRELAFVVICIAYAYFRRSTLVKSHGFSLALENRGKYNIAHKFLTREHFEWMDKHGHRLDFWSKSATESSGLYVDCSSSGILSDLSNSDQSERDFLKSRNVLKILCKVTMLCSFCDEKFSLADIRRKEIKLADNVGFSRIENPFSFSVFNFPEFRIIFFSTFWKLLLKFLRLFCVHWFKMINY